MYRTGHGSSALHSGQFDVCIRMVLRLLPVTSPKQTSNLQLSTNMENPKKGPGTQGMNSCPLFPVQPSLVSATSGTPLGDPRPPEQDRSCRSEIRPCESNAVGHFVPKLNIRTKHMLHNQSVHLDPQRTHNNGLLSPKYGVTCLIRSIIFVRSLGRIRYFTGRS